MRFTANGPNIPDDLLSARDGGNVVFLCGAGVSATVDLPDFKKLTKATMDGLNVEPGSDADLAFKPWADAENKEIPDNLKVPENARPSFDLIFNILQQTYDRDQVGRIVAGQLAIHRTRTEPSRAHQIIAKLSADQSGKPQIVTTNFDRLFEHPEVIADPHWYEPPTFPDLRHNRPISGITYLHGRISDQPEGPHDYVLSSADFGRAYLAEAWATRFIRLMLEKYTVVLLGYSATDPPVRYLLQGLNSAAISDKRRLFAFDKGEPEEIEAKWRDRGVTPIAYGDYAQLWDSLEAWASRAQDPLKWRSGVIAMASTQPSSLEPYQRGQVAHVVRSTIGAKEFADASPSPPPEWLCVFDRFRRMAEPHKKGDWVDEDEDYDPNAAFGLDDDPPRSRQEDRQTESRAHDMVSWMVGDQRPIEQFRLGGRRTRGLEDMPARLFHLARWVSNNADKPVVAWWAALQSGIHPRLMEMIADTVDRSDAMPEVAHRVWKIILEYLNRDDFGPGDMQWFKARRSIRRFGWTPETVRLFGSSIEPYFDRDHVLGVESVRPPVGTWSDLPFRSMAPFSVKFHRHHSDKPAVPDAALLSVFQVMNQVLVRGIERLNQVENVWFPCPSPYRDDDDDTDGYVSETDQFMNWYYELLDRVANLHPEEFKAVIQLWPKEEPKVFDKLRLFVWNKASLFDPSYAAERISSLDQATFWNTYDRRELLRLIRDRWEEIDPAWRSILERRIISGRDRREQDTNGEDFTRRQSLRSAAILTWLVQQGCTLSEEAMSSLAALKAQVPRWLDEWATHADSEAIGRVRGGTVAVNTDASVFAGVPVEQIVDVAKAHTRSPIDELTEYRPFGGLVAADPSKALAALESSAASGVYPAFLWKSLISGWPEGADNVTSNSFYGALKNLPPSVIQELHHYVGSWLRDKLPGIAMTNEAEALSIFDALLDRLVAGGDEVATSGLGEITVGGVAVSNSRRTFEYAINGTFGHATEAWIKLLDGRKLAEGTELPIEYSSRIERLLAAPGEGSDHAISVLGTQLNWLNYISPKWVAARLIPCLTPEHHSAEPLWSGVFHSHHVPNPVLFAAMKEQFLGLFPKLYDWGWERSQYETAHDWLVFACLRHLRDPIYVSYQEAVSSIRQFIPTGRTDVIHCLGRVGREGVENWSSMVIPFIRNAWPAEARFQVEATSAAFLSMLDDASDAFADLYEVVKAHLRPIHSTNHGLYGFYKVLGDRNEPVTTKFPEQVLDLMNRVTPDDPRSVPYDMAQVLAAIVDANASLARDVRYTRLARLVADR